MSAPGYYTGTVREELTPEIRRPDIGSRVHGLSQRLSSAAEDLAFRQSLYAREHESAEQRLASMQHNVSAMQEDKVLAQEQWWNEKEALLRGWSGDHNRLMALMSADVGVPTPCLPAAVVPVMDSEVLRVAQAGDRMMHELTTMRHERSMAAVPERRAAEYRVRALEVQLSRENHARKYAAYANADHGIGAFAREISAGATSIPLGDKLNSILTTNETEALRSRCGELQDRVKELEAQLGRN